MSSVTIEAKSPSTKREQRAKRAVDLDASMGHYVAESEFAEKALKNLLLAAEKLGQNPNGFQIYALVNNQPQSTVYTRKHLTDDSKTYSLFIKQMAAQVRQAHTYVGRHKVARVVKPGRSNGFDIPAVLNLKITKFLHDVDGQQVVLRTQQFAHQLYPYVKSVNIQGFNGPVQIGFDSPQSSGNTFTTNADGSRGVAVLLGVEGAQPNPYYRISNAGNDLFYFVRIINRLAPQQQGKGGFIDFENNLNQRPAAQAVKVLFDQAFGDVYNRLEAKDSNFISKAASGNGGKSKKPREPFRSTYFKFCRFPSLLSETSANMNIIGKYLTAAGGFATSGSTPDLMESAQALAAKGLLDAGDLTSGPQGITGVNINSQNTQFLLNAYNQYASGQEQAAGAIAQETALATAENRPIKALKDIQGGRTRLTMDLDQVKDNLTYLKEQFKSISGKSSKSSGSSR
jgi:hypothetical protein